MVNELTGKKNESKKYLNSSHEGIMLKIFHCGIMLRSLINFLKKIGSQIINHRNGEFGCLVPKVQQSMFLFQAKER